MARVAEIGGFQVSGDVLSAVREASRKTGVDFSYMMGQAAQESAFRADARAGSSSATGLYQFIDSTWLGMVDRHGDKYGMGRYADAIAARPEGGYEVGDPKMRREILAARFDPRMNALMAGELARENAAHLEATVGGKIGATELYLAHFLGAGGAETFLKSRAAAPGQAAAEVFPAAARANPGVFYDGATGRGKTLQEVYDWVRHKISRGQTLAAEASGGIGLSQGHYLAAAPGGGGQGTVGGVPISPVSTRPTGPVLPFETVMTLLDLELPQVGRDGGAPSGAVAPEQRDEAEAPGDRNRDAAFVMPV